MVNVRLIQGRCWIESWFAPGNAPWWSPELFLENLEIW